MLVDATKRDEKSYQKIGNGEKTLWIVLLVASIFFQLTLVVSLIYYFLIYQKGKSAKDK
jgi:cell division protein FtsL